MLLQPSYSSDFFLFPKVKQVVKEVHFQLLEEIQKAVTRVLPDIPIEAFPELLQCMEKSLESLCWCPWKLFRRGLYEGCSISSGPVQLARCRCCERIKKISASYSR